MASHKHRTEIITGLDGSTYGVRLFVGDRLHGEATDGGWRCYLCVAAGLAISGETYADTWAVFLDHEHDAHGSEVHDESSADPIIEAQLLGELLQSAHECIATMVTALQDSIVDVRTEELDLLHAALLPADVAAALTDAYRFARVLLDELHEFAEGGAL